MAPGWRDKEALGASPWEACLAAVASLKRRPEARASGANSRLAHSGFASRNVLQVDLQRGEMLQFRVRESDSLHRSADVAPEVGMCVMTRDQIEEILNEAINELMQAILRAQYAEKAVGALPIGKL